jgi:hypothetical protein
MWTLAVSFVACAQILHLSYRLQYFSLMPSFICRHEMYETCENLFILETMIKMRAHVYNDVCCK